eukprot:TRINITY_DN6797_c0_g1_i1.p1 TRINITY_DN6797_c0_g1~~TRINITY_DN6797_c0_g1_i1.p1  ORF type:complete len:908 (+),score=141.85 TRINITY_DN6797_c0_g1_i1:359-3082(+)
MYHPSDHSLILPERRPSAVDPSLFPSNQPPPYALPSAHTHMMMTFPQGQGLVGLATHQPISGMTRTHHDAEIQNVGIMRPMIAGKAIPPVLEGHTSFARGDPHYSRRTVHGSVVEVTDDSADANADADDGDECTIEDEDEDDVDVDGRVAVGRLMGIANAINGIPQPVRLHDADVNVRKYSRSARPQEKTDYEPGNDYHIKHETGSSATPTLPNQRIPWRDSLLNVSHGQHPAQTPSPLRPNVLQPEDKKATLLSSKHHSKHFDASRSSTPLGMSAGAPQADLPISQPNTMFVTETHAPNPHSSSRTAFVGPQQHQRGHTQNHLQDQVNRPIMTKEQNLWIQSLNSSMQMGYAFRPEMMLSQNIPNQMQQGILSATPDPRHSVSAQAERGPYPQLPSIKSLLESIGDAGTPFAPTQPRMLRPQSGPLGAAFFQMSHVPSGGTQNMPMWSPTSISPMSGYSFIVTAAPQLSTSSAHQATHTDQALLRSSSPLSSHSLLDAVAESIHGTRSGSLQTKRSDFSAPGHMFSSASGHAMASEGASSEALHSSMGSARKSMGAHREPLARGTIQEDDCQTEPVHRAEADKSSEIRGIAPSVQSDVTTTKRGRKRGAPKEEECGPMSNIECYTDKRVEDRSYRVSMELALSRCLPPKLDVAVLFDGPGFARYGLELAGHNCVGFEIDPIAHYLSSYIGSRKTYHQDIWNLNILDQFHAIWISPPIEQKESSTVRSGFSVHRGDVLGWALRLYTRFRDKVIWIETGSLPGSGSNQWGDTYNAGQFLQHLVPGPRGTGQNRNRVIGGRYPPPLVWRRYMKSYPGVCPYITTTEYKPYTGEANRASRFYGRQLQLQECAERMGLDRVPQEWMTPMPSFKGSQADWMHEVYRVVGTGVPIYMARAFGEVCASTFTGHN